MPLRKRAGSPFWQLHLGRKTRVSTGVRHNDEAKPCEAAREFERIHVERLWRLKKLGDRGAISFNEAAERWLSGSASEKKRDRELLEWLSPQVGPNMVREVADSEVFEALRKAGLHDGWSHATVDRMMGTLCAVLKDCANRGELERVPPIPMYRPPQDEPRFLTPDEFDRLRWHLPMHLTLAAVVAVHTLLRMRAMLRLVKSRVNLEYRRAWIPGAHQKQARTFGLPLNDEAVRALRALWLLSPRASPHIFTWMGKPIDDCNTKAFQDAVGRARLEPLRWHDLRHTGASWAVQAGVTLPELMVLGDWKDYRSVLRYAHLAPSSGMGAAQKVAQWSHTERATKPEVRARRRSKSAS